MYVNEPESSKLPVTLWVSSLELPNLVEPLLKITVDCVNSASIFSAVKVPPIDKSSWYVKSSVIEKLPVWVYEPLIEPSSNLKIPLSIRIGGVAVNWLNWTFEPEPTSWPIAKLL